MKDTRTINITLEIAKQLYNSQDENMKALALSAYPELQKPKYPKFENLKAGGYYINAGEIHWTNPDRNNIYKVDRQNWPQRYQANANLILSTLVQLASGYNDVSQNEEPEESFVYVNCKGEIMAKKKGNTYKKSYPLSFKYYTTALAFLNNNIALIEQAKIFL